MHHMYSIIPSCGLKSNILSEFELNDLFELNDVFIGGEPWDKLNKFLYLKLCI